MREGIVYRVLWSDVSSISVNRRRWEREAAVDHAHTQAHLQARLKVCSRSGCVTSTKRLLFALHVQRASYWELTGRLQLTFSPILTMCLVKSRCPCDRVGRHYRIEMTIYGMPQRSELEHSVYVTKGAWGADTGHNRRDISASDLP